MGTNRTAQPPIWISPQGCSPFLHHLKGLGILGIHQQLLGIRVMFSGPGNIHTQMLKLVITQLQVITLPHQGRHLLDQSLG